MAELFELKKLEGIKDMIKHLEDVSETENLCILYSYEI